ncbi:hypothetical protein UFOVP84_12 [uncultured Caudovirales phage]|uniref:Uncharacterized protein n=1 Tax=uncultured Caudovirales phage TaxID=2100421 RepID=A0A6J5L096_9CAUD|nr:hypothetical protein UFOVP84_12 [uncultured Caudovirales phage]
MANCKGECNKQLQGLASRVAQAEDNVANHFKGISDLVENMSTNIFTMPSALASLPIYNGLPGGMEILQALKNMIPDPDMMRQLMLAQAEGLADTLAATMDSIGAAMIAQATAAVSAAEAVVVTAEDTLAAAIAAGEQAPIDAANAALALAQGSVDAAKAAKDSVSGFMDGQAKISKCKTKSFLLGD